MERKTKDRGHASGQVVPPPRESVDWGFYQAEVMFDAEGRVTIRVPKESDFEYIRRTVVPLLGRTCEAQTGCGVIIINGKPCVTPDS